MAHDQKKFNACLTVLKNNALTTLNLSGQALTTDDLTCLFTTLKRNTSLKTLDLSRNDMDEAGMILLTAFLYVNKTLLSLRLNNNKINPRVAGILLAGLKRNVSLRVLDVSRNAIGEDGARAFAKVLKDHPTLRSLDISYNDIGQAVLQDFRGMLRDNHTLLSFSYIAGNHITGNAGSAISYIGYYLRRNQRENERKVTTRYQAPQDDEAVHHYALRGEYCFYKPEPYRSISDRIINTIAAPVGALRK